jgi:branched-chain amino acid transport system substrate-binding protein
MLLVVAAACGGNDNKNAGGKDTRPGTTAPTAKLECKGPAATGDPVTVGFMWPSGQAINQPDVEQAADATVKYANDCLSGVAGRPIKLDKCPDAENQAAVTACANQFIQDKVDVVAVSSTAFPDAIATPVTAAGIPYTSAVGVSTEMINPKVDIFGSGAGGALGAVAAYAKDNNIKSVAAVVVDTLTGQLQAFAKPAFDTAGVGLDLVGVPSGTPDMTQQLRSALNKNPGAIVVVGDENLCISFLQGVKALAVKIPTLVIQTCTSASVVKAVGKDTLEGKIVAGANDATSNDAEAQLYRAIMDKYSPDTDKFGFAGYGYTSILSLVRGLSGMTGDVTPDTINTALGRDKDYPLPIGHGIMLNCSKTYFQKPAALVGPCTGSTLVATIKDTVISDPKVVDVAPLFGGG